MHSPAAMRKSRVAKTGFSGVLKSNLNTCEAPKPEDVPQPGVLRTPLGVPSGDQSLQDKTRRICLQKQLRKTKFCMYYLQGVCQFGDGCAFAHSCTEMQSVPDLRKTRICKDFAIGHCGDWACPFAHGEEELRSTDMCFKKTLCMWYEKGRCRNGAHCRFAHGSSELRATSPSVPPKDAVSVKNKVTEASDCGNLQKYVGASRNGYTMGTVAGATDSDDSDSTSGWEQTEEQRLWEPMKIQTGLTVSTEQLGLSASNELAASKQGHDNLTNQLGRVLEATRSAPSGLEGILQQGVWWRAIHRAQV